MFNELNRAIGKEQERLADELGVSVPELMARACHNLKRLRERKGLIVITGGKQHEDEANHERDT